MSTVAVLIQMSLLILAIELISKLASLQLDMDAQRSNEITSDYTKIAGLCVSHCQIVL
jgi:hypothetical protein